MLRIALFLALAALCGCRTTDDAIRDQFKPWIGRPLRDFIVETGVPPVRVDDRTWIFVDQRALGAPSRPMRQI
ncbi:hypothetical protein ASG52_05410 [Methylobacterium sp. Leaf456]|uniref:hypothetical protein n=1 Tax=Methylobacterium sp. Leaf456 TaxID=1736382 RepID=UPI0006F3CA50|nr:hypothetical protein [Methylobacterium sp. Leaf456]KQT53554.1 hypothetical protein ASG52_05410 [Methylobacterium sp. Leaf456]